MSKLNYDQIIYVNPPPCYSYSNHENLKIAKNRNIYIQVGDIISGGIANICNFLIYIKPSEITTWTYSAIQYFQDTVISKCVHLQQVILL